MKNKRVLILSEKNGNLIGKLVNRLVESDEMQEIIILSEKTSFWSILRRILLKLQVDGPRATIKRIIGIFGEPKIEPIISKKIRYITVASYSTNELDEFLLPFEFAIACTNTYIPQKMISKFPNGIWNAHPGALPYYRGLNSADRMLVDGYYPIVSVHKIDHGIDTGPLWFVLRPNYGQATSFGEIMQILEESQVESLYCAISKLFQQNQFKLHDTFMLPSRIESRYSRTKRNNIRKQRLVHLKHFDIKLSAKRLEYK